MSSLTSSSAELTSQQAERFNPVDCQSSALEVLARPATNSLGESERIPRRVEQLGWRVRRGLTDALEGREDLGGVEAIARDHGRVFARGEAGEDILEYLAHLGGGGWWAGEHIVECRTASPVHRCDPPSSPCAWSSVLAVTADRLIPDLWQALSTQVDFGRGPLTNAQQSAIPHALAAATSGRVPDALFVHEPGDAVLYAIYWIEGSVFGVLNVMNIGAGYSGVPEFGGWVRAISELSRVDLRVVIERGRVVVSEVDVRLDATLNWRDGETPVRVDGTFSGNHWARDAAIALIKIVLARVGAELEEPGS